MVHLSTVNIQVLVQLRWNQFAFIFKYAISNESSTNAITLSILLQLPRLNMQNTSTDNKLSVQHKKYQSKAVFCHHFVLQTFYSTFFSYNLVFFVKMWCNIFILSSKRVVCNLYNITKYVKMLYLCIKTNNHHSVEYSRT